MSNYAIIAINNKQYLVEEGKEYVVPKFAADLGKFNPEVLAAKVKDNFMVGTPTVDKATVELDVTEQGLGEKVKSRIFKAKSRYRRTRGTRKRVTTFKVVSIK